LLTCRLVQVIYEKILNAIGAESVPVVLVGNKSDLSGDRYACQAVVEQPSSNLQQYSHHSFLYVALSRCFLSAVTVEEAQALAAKWNCRMIECSAKLNENIASIFSTLLDQVDKDLAPVKVEKERSTCIVQ
jgi:Ras family protein